MNFSRILIFSIAVQLFLSFSGFSSQSPSELAKISHAAMKNEDWATLAGVFKGASLAEFRKGFDFLFSMSDKGLQKKIIANFFGSSNNKETVMKMDDKTFFMSIYGNLIKSASVFGSINYDSLKVIGSLPENDSLEHVLIRKFVTIRKTNIEELEILTFVKINGLWKMELSDRIKSISSQIKASLGL